MKQFIRQVFFFLLPVFALFQPLDYILSDLLRKSKQFDGEIEVMNEIYDGNLNCDVAIYGSSRAKYHIDPSIIEDSLMASAYNFGINGHDFQGQYLRHLEFLKHNARPGTILLSLDSESLNRRKHLTNYEQFLPYMLWNKNISHFTSFYIGYRQMDSYIPLIRYAGKTSPLKESLSILFNGAPSERATHKGFVFLDKPWHSDLEDPNLKVERYEIEIDPDLVNLFEKFVKECEELGIRLVLVYTPQHVLRQQIFSNRYKIIDLYNEIASKYSLLFLDYSEEKICFNKEFFHDSNHLNRIGADAFSKMLVHDLKSK